jgi:DNA-binding beta-propeller fold protein YncE
MSRRLRWLVPLFGFGVGGCAATTAPSPAPEELLVVLNAGDHSLTLVPVDSTHGARVIPFGPLTASAVDLAARGELAVVAGGASDAVIIVHLGSGQVFRTVALPVGSRPAAVAMVDERTAYVANAGINTTTRIDLFTGDTASLPVGTFPRDLLLARGRLFVVNGNVGPCPAGLCSLGASWLTVVDPQTNALATGRDSIPLPGQGNARSATLGGDGLIYLIHTGSVEPEAAGRLTIVDPVDREEVGSFGGFGLVPQAVASDGGERLFVASIQDGLMEFNTRTRRVVRGAGEGISLVNNVAVAVDSRGRVYAIESGGCSAGSVGRIRVYRPDLTEAGGFLLGACPLAATFVQRLGLPPTQAN